MVANRLKIVLPLIISESESAFVPGRLITDNVITAFEINHFLRKKTAGKVGHFSLKIDMSKAYDKVEWGFLEKMLLKLGFDCTFVNVVMRCVSTASFLIVLNGDPVGFFKPGKGLCQGDPLSPYLFILCAEGLSSLYQVAEQNGKFPGIRVSRGSLRVSHLFALMIVSYSVVLSLAKLWRFGGF